MNLWVRSQDKEDLIKVDNLGLAYQEKYNFMDKIGDIDNYCICQFVDDYHVKLGTYKTKERAIEVLDEIQNFMRDYACVKKTNRLGEEIDLIPKPILIYNMPKE